MQFGEMALRKPRVRRARKTLKFGLPRLRALSSAVVTRAPVLIAVARLRPRLGRALPIPRRKFCAEVSGQP
jgi:hypothetical protein